MCSLIYTFQIRLSLATTHVAYRLVCLSVCLCAGYLKKLWKDTDEILWTGWMCDRDKVIGFWWIQIKLGGHVGCVTWKN